MKFQCNFSVNLNFLRDKLHFSLQFAIKKRDDDDDDEETEDAGGGGK